MANKCGLCNIFARKSDLRYKGVCRRFVHAGCVEQQSSSSAVMDASNFFCNNCTVLRHLSVGPSSNVSPNSSAPATSVFSEPESVPPGSALVASIQVL